MSALRHLHSLDDLSQAQLHRLLDRAEGLRHERCSEALRGRSIVLLFLSPSLRTRVSMELAAQQLGAHYVCLQADAGLWKLEIEEGVVMDGVAAEHMKEAARVLSRYGDLLAVRAFPQKKSWEDDARDPVLNGLKRWSEVPVLNLESSLYHPCQSAADLLTIRNSRGAEPGKIVLAWCDHPMALPVAVPNSFALAVTQMGWDLTIARPEGYDLPPEIMERCRGHAAAAGSSLETTADRDAAFEGARVIYAKSWGRIDRYGAAEQELAERQAEGLARWTIDAAAMNRGENPIFMHCLPVRRNVIVSDDVIDGPGSRVFDQAENRLHAQKAILEWQLGALELS